MSRACGPARRTGRSKSAPTSSSGPTAGARRCGNGPGLAVTDLGAPMDVLWMRLSRRPGDPEQPAGRFDRGVIMVMLDRGDYWQCGYVIPKGGMDAWKAKGIEAFRAAVGDIAPFVRDRVGEMRGWDDVKLLTVTVDRLRKWYRPGLLCIGDSAHAMSPVGGVGINLAVQDAVAAANVLAEPLRKGTVTAADCGGSNSGGTFRPN